MANSEMNVIVGLEHWEACRQSTLCACLQLISSLQPPYHQAHQSVTWLSLVDLASWWPLTWPNHSFSLGKNTCIPPQWKIILLFKKEKNASFCQIYNKNSYDFIYWYMWLIDSMRSLKISLFKKENVYVRNSLQIELPVPEILWLEIAC